MAPDKILTRLRRASEDLMDAAEWVENDADTAGTIITIADDLRDLRLSIERETLCVRSAA